MKLILN